jgi:hypothetical protein
MAVILRSGEVKHDPRLLDGSGTHRIDEIRATFEELTELFGRDDYVEEADPAWAIRVENPDEGPTAIVLLHSYKDIRPRAYKHSTFMWSLNANGRENQWAADRVKEAITEHRKGR